MIGLDSDPLKNRRQFHGKARVPKKIMPNSNSWSWFLPFMRTTVASRTTGRLGFVKRSWSGLLCTMQSTLLDEVAAQKNYCSPNTLVLERLAFWGKGTQLAILVSYKELIFRDQDKIIDKTIRYFSFHLFVYISKRKIPMQKSLSKFLPKTRKTGLDKRVLGLFRQFFCIQEMYLF